ncbi:MAG: hypothetical protein A07HR60_01526 [uncultured archaeon A07HR60]|nr:MAG: hypothetical protein A07HR60_01526 [uncultured archaeon A07HR60]
MMKNFIAHSSELLAHQRSQTTEALIVRGLSL